LPNNGHYWTTEQDQALLSAWQIANKSQLAFAREYGDAHGLTADAVRNRLKKLLFDQKDGSTGEGASFEQGEDFIHVICASRRMLSKEDVINQFKIDINQWEVEKFKVKTSEGYRKDRKVKWKVVDGRVVEGDVDDTGQMLVVPLYHIEVHLVRKTEQIRATSAIRDLIDEAKRGAPKYPKIKREPMKDGLLYEIAMPDLHFGRLAWDEETGENYDVRIAADMVRQVLADLLAYAAGHPVAKILLPLGNDFLNVDNKEETTTHGTRQQEDDRWQKTYRLGRQLLVEIVDRCSEIAPVDVIIVTGNHDEQRMFYLGDALECWFHHNPNVTINNRAMKRKYYLFGKCLIGFTHGYWEKLESLPGLMPVEQPDLWQKSLFREWHTGDKHHKKDLAVEADEGTGMVVRVLRSLAPADAWTFDKGYVGALRAAESFLWHPERGLIAQFTATPKPGTKSE
jgi:hypothetical protein